MKRRPLAVLFLTVFIDLVGFGIVIPILPLYAKRFGASAIAVGLLGTTYSAVQLLVSPLWGRLSDRIGRRPIILFSAAGAGVAYLVTGLSGSLVMLFVARAIGGACAANISTAQAYIADVTAPEDRARGMGIIGAGFGLGFIFGPAIGGVGAHFGPDVPFFIAASLSALNVVWAWFALPEPPTHRARARRDVGSFADAVRDRTLAFLLVVFFVNTFAFANIESTFALFTNARLQFTERENGYVFAYIGIVLVLVQMLGTRRLVKRFGERRMIAAGTACLCLGAALTPIVRKLGVLVPAATLIACGNAFTAPSLMSLISRSAPGERQGEMLGVAQSFSALGRILGPAAGGLLFDLGFNHALPYVAASVLFGGLAISVGITSVRESRRDTPTER